MQNQDTLIPHCTFCIFHFAMCIFRLRDLCALCGKRTISTQAGDSVFHYCFNTSTIRGQKLSIVEVVDIVAQAGYQAIEPWINEIEAYVQKGGSLPDLKKRISDLG